MKRSKRANKGFHIRAHMQKPFTAYQAYCQKLADNKKAKRTQFVVQAEKILSSKALEHCRREAGLPPASAHHPMKGQVARPLAPITVAPTRADLLTELAASHAKSAAIATQLAALC